MCEDKVYATAEHLIEHANLQANGWSALRKDAGRQGWTGGSDFQAVMFLAEQGQTWSDIDARRS